MPGRTIPTRRSSPRRWTWHLSIRRTSELPDMSDLQSLGSLKAALVSAQTQTVAAAQPVDETESAEPKIDNLGRAYATGKRKDAVARVWIKRGTGKFTVNGRDSVTYFARPVLRMLLAQP